MTSDKRKSLSRLSALFFPHTKPTDSPTPTSPSTTPRPRKERKFSLPLLTEMSFTAAWPLPERTAKSSHGSHVGGQLKTVKSSPVEHRSQDSSSTVVASSVAKQASAAAPPIAAAPPQLNLNLPVATPDSQKYPLSAFAHRAQRARSASSSAVQSNSQGSPALESSSQGPGLHAPSPESSNPAWNHVISNRIAANSSIDLLQPVQPVQPQQGPPNPPNKLLRHQKSENALRHQLSKNARASTITRGSSTKDSFAPSRVAPLPPLPNMPALAKAPPRSTPAQQPLKKKKGWFSAKNAIKTKTNHITSAAWITGTPDKTPYDILPLTTGSRVPELWKEQGNVLVYLFPKSLRRGPSFRINTEDISSSSYLASLAHGNVYSSNSAHQSRSSLAQNGPVSFDPRTQRIHANVPGGSSIHTSPNASHTDGSDDSRESRVMVDADGEQLVHLYLPVELSNPAAPQITGDDAQKLVIIRNLFAFLIGQSLIATPKYPTVFNVFCQIARLLEDFHFSNMDASTFGEVASTSFESYIEELGLLDMRESAGKILEALILGERMRSSVLWNEAFTHGVGRYSDIQMINHPLTKSLTPVAVSRIERAHMDLEKRILRINDRVADFDFPSVFSGIMNSRTAAERGITNFEQWRSGFQATRKFFISYLKSKHKSWPPKRAKYAGPSVPALNRSVLQGLYSDLTVLYDLMVDRKHPSSRLMIFGRNFPPHTDRRIEALRKILLEYDQSGTPVYPVMPFDAPRLPRISPNDDDITVDNPKKLGKHELANLLKASYNKDTHDAKHPFSQLWQSWEFRSTHGMPIDKVANFRLGAWLFVYCVLQALPMLTVDAPSVLYSEGVEYFLCKPPRGRLHWSKEGTQWEWFRDPVTGVVTQLSKDAIDLSDEAMYRLSHCWQQGAKWEQELTLLPGKPSAPGNSLRDSMRTRTPSLHPSDNVQLPTPPTSEHSFDPRYSVASSQGHHSVQQPHLSLQQVYEDPYLQQHHTASPKSHSPHQNSPKLGTFDSPSFAPVQFSQHLSSSPTNNSMPDLGGFDSSTMLSPPDEYSAPAPRSRHSSYGVARRGNRESILMMGLERLPMPAASSSPVTREQRDARSASRTFDEILAPAGVPLGPTPEQRQRSRSRHTVRSIIRV